MAHSEHSKAPGFSCKSRLNGGLYIGFGEVVSFEQKRFAARLSEGIAEEVAEIETSGPH